MKTPLNSPKKFIIGTRGSLLALTQAGQVKKELEEKTNCAFELKVITTQGDQVTDKALWQIEGKDFFTKELDQALLSREIDLVIHSYKDLGSVRPNKIKLAAITKRQYASDVLLIKNETLEQLKNWPDGREFIVGTSAPRRIANITSSLHSFLPAKNIKVKCETLRGNVNSRIQKLTSHPYDAIILAHAGLERLALTPSSAKELESLLENLSFKVLPFSHFPPAASQGSLALETHEENTELVELLKTVHDPESESTIKKERETFLSYGGGCHLALGIHVKSWNGKLIEYKKGQVNDQVIDETQFITGEQPKLKVNPSQLFIGFKRDQSSLNNTEILYDELIKLTATPQDKTQKNLSENLFITSSHCLEALDEIHEEQFLWAAGTNTHQKLAKLGYWVCADTSSLGVAEIHYLLESKALKIMLGKKTTLTVMGEDQSDQGNYELIPSYSRSYLPPSEDFLKKLRNCTQFYWTSYPQFEHYSKYISDLKTNKNYLHFSGLGKTYTKLQNIGIDVTPIIHYQDLLA